MPYDRSKYPDNWEEISRLVRHRAGNRCQFCGLMNGLQGFRRAGRFIPLEPGHLAEYVGSRIRFTVKTMRVVLTVAHLNHDPMDCREENLRALCQRCHLRWDLKLHSQNAARTRDQKRRQMSLLP